MPKHKKENPTSNQHEQSPMGPDALKHLPESVDPATHGRVGNGGNQTQNLNQNHITQTGNPIHNNTPGGNFNTARSARTNKPRNNPNPSRFGDK